MISALSTVLVITITCAALAALLVLADKFFINAGPVTIKINEEQPRKVTGGGTLLSALREEGVFIPSACGGRGSCGMCRVRIAKGGGQLLPTEMPHLSEEERADNVRLSCQVKVRADMEIDIPAELMSVKEYAVTVTTIKRLNYDTVRITLEFAPGVFFFFTAGQYVQLETPIYDGLPYAVQRAYSIASPPDERWKVELLIRKVQQGIATTFTHELLQLGDRLSLSGPFGDFVIKPTPAEAVFIAAGSGLAPFESILANIAAEQPEKKITLFFGAVSARDLYDMGKFIAYEKIIPGFKFIPALSQPRPEDKWEGATGLVTTVVAEHYGDMAGMEAYLCGSQGMVDACIRALARKNVAEQDIFYDKFG